MPGADIKRGFQSRSGRECADVQCPVFHIESKHGQKPNVRAALAQAQADAAEGTVPIAVIRDNRKPAFVAIELDRFLEFVEEWWRAQQPESE